MGDNDKLLIRVYDVGFGDCVYVRVPDEAKNQSTGEAELRDYHILIDCGSTAWQDAIKPKPKKTLDKLQRALKDVHSVLPQEQGSSNKRLDLLVVTHPHADHFNGFDPNMFAGITIKRIWLSVFMNKEHPQAKGSRALQALAYRATLSLLQRGLPLGSGLRELLRAKQGNEEAENALETTLPDSSGTHPLYVWRDIADASLDNRKRLKAEEWQELGPQLEELQFDGGSTCLQVFEEAGTRLRVLAPEWDIDHEYLGKEALDYQSLVDRYPDHYPLGTRSDDYRLLLELDERNRTEASVEVERETVPSPSNISKRDFRTLRNRLFHSALRFTGKEHEIVNNTSVVLLLEWRGRRLLFVGDAQWKGRYSEEESNASWDVMLEMLEEQGHFSKALDFLKLGHHGSVNGVPFVEPKAQDRIPQPTLDGFLPEAGEARILVSTCHTNRHPTIPCGKLLTELGCRGKVLMTNEPADLNYPEDDPFAIEETFDAAPGWSP